MVFRNEEKRASQVTSSAKEGEGMDTVLIEIANQCSDIAAKRPLI